MPQWRNGHKLSCRDWWNRSNHQAKLDELADRLTANRVRRETAAAELAAANAELGELLAAGVAAQGYVAEMAELAGMSRQAAAKHLKGAGETSTPAMPARRRRSTATAPPA